MYRAYSKDEVIEIVSWDDSLVGYAARHVQVAWQPQAKDGEPEGMRILTALPSHANLAPASFVPGTVILCIQQLHLLTLVQYRFVCGNEIRCG